MSQDVLSERLRLLLLVLYLASKYVRERVAGLGKHVVPSRIRVMKLVFLVQKECSEPVKKLAGGVPYVFEPYLHGPFSKDVLSDLEELQRLGFIEVYAEPIDVYGMSVRYIYVLTEKGVEEAEKIVKYALIDRELKEALEKVENTVRKYAPLSTDELLHYVYKNYPKESTPIL